MLKKTITYVDYDGVERTEDFYFNLSEAELIKMETRVNGGMRAMLERIVKANNTTEIMAVFDEFLDEAYGEKTPDGKRFVKIRPDGSRCVDEFKQTEAYSQLYMELLSDEKKCAEFFAALIPAKLAEEVKKNGGLPQLSSTAE